jgi:mannosyltransferase OCH1-like enzyme
MTSKKIYLYDNNINDNIFLLENNIIYSISDNKNNIGILEKIKDIFYKIKWNENNLIDTYIFSFDEINFYKNDKKNTILLTDKIKYIKIENCFWNDTCILNIDNSKIYRKNNYFDDGTFNIYNNELIIKWTNYGYEKYLLSCDEEVYYSNNYIEKYFKKIYIIDNNTYFYYNIKQNFINDINLNKIVYYVNNKDGHFIVENNNNNILYFITDNIYTFQRILYINYINTKYILYDINDTEINFYLFKNLILYNNNLYNYTITDNNDILLNNNIIINSNITFKFYTEKKEKDNIKYYYEESIYNLKYIIKNNNKLNYIEEYTLYKNYNEYLQNKIKSNIKIVDNLIFVIIHNKDLSNILNKIDYLINEFNYKIIIFENIVNKKKYEKYYEYLNIIYYFNINVTINLLYDFIKINNNNIFYIYSDNYEYFNNKITNNKLIFYSDYDIHLFYNNYDNISSIKSYYNTRYENLKYETKYENINKIPKLIHFVWIGENNIPHMYLEYIESWIRYHPDYNFCLWNNDNIPKLVNQDLFDLATEYAMKVDILRYELIYFLGGIYIDCDFLCVKNIDDLICDNDNFCCFESDKYITNAIFGFKKEHPFLLNVIKNLKYNFFIYKNVIKNNLYIPKITGPEYFTMNCNNYNNLCKGLNILNKEIFYSYSFQNKYNNNNLIIKKENYGIHMWGNSWNNKNEDINNEDNDKNKDNDNLDINYTLKLFLTNKIQNLKNKYYNYNKNNILYKKSSNKITIVHIIGIFFSGGIERLMYYFNKYGNNDKYNYIILCHGFSDKNYYDIDNINIISFDGNQNKLNNYLLYLNPYIILDHYSIYIDNNDIIYKNINKNIVIQFMHTAILYKKDISNYNIKKCIHLYKEENNIINNSWNNIADNYYITLGCVLDNNHNKKNVIIEKSKIVISIVGRIASEKIPIDFLKLLNDFSIKNNKKFTINIYGEKDYIFNKEYLIEFDNIICNSNINYLNFVDSDNIYNCSDILLIPSLYETGSFVCIEAFKNGIPVIGRNVYGLKHLINNDITGFLYNNDEQCFDILKSLTKKKIKSMKDSIIKESLKYNIVDKIKEIENIIDNVIHKNTNIIIITSILNCPNTELSYSAKRTVFSFNSRFRQTINTIESIKKYLGNCDILFCDCSDMSNYSKEENIIKSMVKYYYNFYNDDKLDNNILDNDEILENNDRFENNNRLENNNKLDNDDRLINKSVQNAVTGKYKGHGEAMILLKALNIINNLDNQYKYIYKLSGRYYLNDNFDINIFENNENIFTHWDNCKFSLCTVFYKIIYNERQYFYDVLKKSIYELIEGNSIEICLYKYFLKNINIVEKINVSGFLSTEGYNIDL